MANDSVLVRPSAPHALIGLHAARQASREATFSFLQKIEPEIPVRNLVIRATQSAAQKHQAVGLAGRRYAERGYRFGQADDHVLTLSASDQHRMLGTLGIRFDSERGLNADAVFADELRELRHSGKVLCEFTQLALDSEAPSKRVLAALFHNAYLHAHRLRGAQLLVVEVNPRHVAYYRRMLGFKVCSEVRTNARVQAPAVLMCLDFTHVELQIARYGGQPALASVARTLYPYAYSPREEAAIMAELRQAH